MTAFSVSLFGHRELCDLHQVDMRLTPIINNLLQNKSLVVFLIGRNGEFDEYAASVIKRAQRRVRNDNSDLSLVLPYEVANLQYYEKYYDSIIIPEAVNGVHPKSAIVLKNRWMVEQSDLVIVCVERNKGGAYEAMKYAQSLNKEIINIYEYKTE